MSNIKDSICYTVSDMQMQDMEKRDFKKLIRYQLQQRVNERIVNKIPFTKLKTPDYLGTAFVLTFYLATEEEFWEEVHNEAKKLLNERERNQK